MVPNPPLNGTIGHGKINNVLKSVPAPKIGDVGALADRCPAATLGHVKIEGVIDGMIDALVGKGGHSTNSNSSIPNNG